MAPGWSYLLPLVLVLPFNAAKQPPNQIPLATFSWIRKFASIGDSYSAGLGAGSRIDWACSRYDHSYPNTLHTSLLGHDDGRTHQFLACSGATSDVVLDSQVSALDQDIDLLTISAGGNDIGLTPILSNCIYQFYMAGEDECEKSLKKAEEHIADDRQLYKSVAKLVDAAKQKMNQDHGVIYLTGYAGFFGVDDHACDNVTWAVWRNVEPDKQYLKLELRRALNELVRAVNHVLRRVSDDAGPNVRFIDYDSEIAANRGRYCESGVQEPAPNRPGLSFYEWNTIDSGENVAQLLNQTGGDVPKGSFQGGIAELVEKTLREHPEWQFDAEKGGFVDRTRAGLGDEGIIGDVVHWMLPDAWKRVFHMRPEGHAVLARLIVEDLVANGSGEHRTTQAEEL